MALQDFMMFVIQIKTYPYVTHWSWKIEIHGIFIINQEQVFEEEFKSNKLY